MPWRVVAADHRCPASKSYAVVREDTGELVACHTTNASAVAQLHALYASEPQDD